MSAPVPPASPLAQWAWWPLEGRLDIEASPATGAATLAGSWTLDALRHLVDGLSGARLRESFLAGVTGDPARVVNCALALPDGLRVQLVGGFVAPDEARGILLVEAAGPSARRGALEDTHPPELRPVFQPVFEARTGRLCGFEALARWAGRTGIDPKEFEEAGLATAMLLHAADLARSLCQTGPDAPFVAVNLTARDLARSDLAAFAGELVAARGLPPGRLQVELTEQAALRDPAVALSAARALKAAGLGLVLDDFGAGHSSFVWLCDVPADALKLDADIVARRVSARGQAVIAAIVALAHELGMSVTAEGVERASEAEALAALGVDRIQGFALSRPLDSAQALRLARRQA